ncbi:GNAT family N-acetyltransferase [Mycobacterium sp.]|uniref:GNAT family N-acetyltransferase n=1 Tax=Mycobacterium sp. TaxID=1785 RepID=UPI00344CEF9E
MDIALRPGTPDDAGICGRICYSAFRSIAAAHNFPTDFPTPEAAIETLAQLFAHPGFYSVVAEAEGRIVGSNFLDERGQVCGVGPASVDPAVQNRGIGRRLMLDVMRRGAARGAPSVRLLQIAYHNRSLALYATLGFEVRDLLGCLQGPPPRVEIPGYRVRQATPADLDACNTLCRAIHGHDRGGELADGISLGTAMVVEHGGRITGYASGIGLYNHAVGECNEALKALIASAKRIESTGVLVPTTNAELFGWCLRNGLRIVDLRTLMTTGLYSSPRGAYLPAILY